jgi:pimeloyl-ACP methyl ester carboxylesterase
MLHSLHGHAVATSLKLICVNRPGKGGTSKSESDGPESHTATACRDAITVLDALAVSQASLLFMCAGTPFALSFANSAPERTTGQLVGVASWVPPADCNDAKTLYKVGSALPSWLISPIVGGSMTSVTSGITSLPQSWLVSGLKSDLTALEREAFDRENPDAEIFVRKMAWMQEETGGMSEDIAVLLGASEEIGLDCGSIRGQVWLYHGEEDSMVPIAGAEWLGRQIPSAVLQRIPHCSHTGAMMMFHQSVADSFQMLARSS